MNLTHNDKSFVLTGSYLLDIAKKAPELFKSSKPALKGKLLKFLLSNLEIHDKTLSFKLKTPFDVIAECSQSTDWREVVLTLRTSAPTYESFEFDNLFEAIEEHEPELAINLQT